MALKKKILTDRDKAAICYHILENCEDWEKLYLLSLDDETLKHKKTLSYLNSAVSRWKNSEGIKNYLKQINEKLQKIRLDAQTEAVINERKQQTTKDKIQEQNINGDNVRTESENEKPARMGVDYSDPANQRRKLNQIINQASNSGEALDALKVIIAAQKDDKQAAREQKQVKIYLPLTCDECPLYEKAKEMLQ